MDYKAVIDEQISLLKEMQKETQDECKKGELSYRITELCFEMIRMSFWKEE